MDRNLKEQWERLKEAVQTRDGTKALDELYEFVEDTFIDPSYCPSCGSCGDTGCHPNPNVCHYVDAHQKDLDAIIKREELFSDTMDQIDALASTWRNVPDISTDIALAYTLGQISSLFQSMYKRDR